MNVNKLCKISVIALVVGLISVSSSLAQIVISPGSNLRGDNFTGSVGIEFTVGANDVQVTQLGYYDNGNDGLTLAHEVGIFTTAGASVVEATIGSGTAGTLSNGYRYVTLGSPVTLTSGVTYRLAAGVTDSSGDDWFDQGGTGHIFASDFTNVAPTFGFGGNAGDAQAPVNVNTVNAGTGFNAPNFQYTVVPEPSTYALVLGGLGLLYGLRKMRNKQEKA